MDGITAVAHWRCDYCTTVYEDKGLAITCARRCKTAQDMTDLWNLGKTLAELRTLVHPDDLILFDIKGLERVTKHHVFNYQCPKQTTVNPDDPHNYVIASIGCDFCPVIRRFQTANSVYYEVSLWSTLKRCNPVFVGV